MTTTLTLAEQPHVGISAVLLLSESWPGPELAHCEMVHTKAKETVLWARDIMD